MISGNFGWFFVLGFSNYGYCKQERSFERDQGMKWVKTFFRSFRRLCPEAATGGVLQKRTFLKISQNSQENTQARVCTFIEKEALAQVFSCEFCEIFNNTYLTEHLLETASVCLIYYKKRIHINVFCITSIIIYTFSEQTQLNKLKKLFININYSISKSNNRFKYYIFLLMVPVHFTLL